MSAIDFCGTIHIRWQQTWKETGAIAITDAQSEWTLGYHIENLKNQHVSLLNNIETYCIVEYF